MGVSLRKQNLQSGKQSLYLDIYHKKRRWTEFLDIKLEKPNSPDSRYRNKEKLKIAESIKAKKVIALKNKEYDFRSEEMDDVPYLDYFKGLVDGRLKGTTKSNGDNWLSTYKHLIKFIGKKSLKLRDIDEKFLEGFKNYLLSNLSQNSSHSYFNKVRASLKQAHEQRIINDNPVRGVKGIKVGETKREYLTEEEVKMIAKTDCKYPVMKRAFLFSVLTGIRWSDINKLIWKEVRGSKIEFRQKKTLGVEYLPINQEALQLLGVRGGDNTRVFKGLKYSAYHNLELLRWMMRAGITKHITFHCGRHTHAVLLLSNGTDIYTVSKLLGHRELKTTQIYAQIVDEKKEKEVNSLPSIL